MKKMTFFRTIGLVITLFLGNNQVYSQSFSETFNDITLLAGNGWVMTNASVAVGSTNWFQGNPVSGGGPFDAYNGATNAYIGANYNNTGSTGTISNWLMTPNRTFRNGDVITFYTRKVSPDSYADRLEVRLSTNGASTTVGTGTGVGDYTTLLLSVNPSLVLGVYPTSWTLYTITISGLAAPTSGRIAFRYYVTSAGFSGTNSDYIGIDQVDYTPYVCPAFTMTAAGALTGGTAGTAYSTSLSQTGALGTPSFAITAGALPAGLSLATDGTISGNPTATGTFNFTVTVSDASGCSGSESYSIQIVCPANPTTLNGLPTICSNDSPITLTQGLPVGGTYSGTGVTGNLFDPAAGTQTITYDYTDLYGCAHSTSNTITVNTAPTVTLGSFPDLCSNASPLGLSGGSPAGGSFSGVGVTGTDFDPVAGSQTITYSYTDGNGCSASATSNITVNTAPTVSHVAVADICENNGVIVLSGGTPAGGLYSGTGVTGTNFDPSAGSQTITYLYTDAFSCSNEVTFDITVIPSEQAVLPAFSPVCDNDGLIALTTGSPAGGVYSGTGVTGSDFDPSVGTQTITYTIGVATSCESAASQVFDVNTSPVVGLTLSTTEMCVYHDAATLSGGSPAAGTYSGTGVSGGIFDPAVAGSGTTTITYTFSDGNGCSNSATDMIVVDECLGIDESTKSVSFTVYPNPNQGTFNVQASIDISSFDMNVIDITGKFVNSSIQLNTSKGLDISVLTNSKGIYFLTGIINNEAVCIRFSVN